MELVADAAVGGICLLHYCAWMAFSPLSECHIGQLMGGDVQLLGENLPVACRLIEHIDEVAVLQDVGDLRAGQEVLAVLGNSGRHPAPFSEPLPNLYAPTRQLAFRQK